MELSLSKEILRPLRNLVYKNPPLVRILSQINIIPILSPYLSNIDKGKAKSCPCALTEHHVMKA